jgi:molybdopterin-guanine dinucleotide biosynthesis protein A
MGSDKAFLELGGQIILAHLLEGAAAGFRDVVLVANDLPAYAEALTRLEWSRQPDAGSDAGSDPGSAATVLSFRKASHQIRLFGDERPGLGPLAGLEVGLRAARYPRSWVLGCDFPFVVGEVGRRLLRSLADLESRPAEAHQAPAESPGPPGAVVPIVNQRLQTLCAAVRSDACRVAADCLDHGRHRMTHLLERIGFEPLDSARFADLGDPERLFLNLNRPRDLERARAWLE